MGLDGMNVDSAELRHTHFDSLRVRRVVERGFRGYTGSLGVRLWDGISTTLGRGSPAATIVFHTARVLRDLAWRPDPLRLAEAYLSGEVDVEGDLHALLTQRPHLQSLTLSMRYRLSLFSAVLFFGRGSGLPYRDNASVRWSKPLQLRASRRHSKALNREAIAFHYDVSNEFYRLWLDEQMVYSCAYFNDPDESLDQAQLNKLDHICRKLRLRQGERLLDIGCGWGALIRRAAMRYGVQAHGITLSHDQYEYSKEKIREQGLEKLVTVELRDYRDVAGEMVFDKIASVGMFEHVGLKNLPLYFRTARRLLKPDGLFLNHGITHDEEGWRNTPATKFINRYVFPDGELDTVSDVQREMERSQFEILNVEALRPHYALTLRHWVRRLEDRRQEALRHINEATYRVWRLYMAACALEFESGGIGVYQILASRKGRDLSAAPLTRRDLYPCKNQKECKP